MQFPVFTICDINQVKKSDIQDPQIQQVLSKAYMEIEKDITYFSSLDGNWSKNIDVHGIFYNSSHNVFDMFLMCLWENKPVQCSSIFTSRVTSAGICASLVDLELTENGGIGSDMGVTVILQSNTSDYLVTSTPGSGFRTSFLKHPIPAFGDDFCIDSWATDYVSKLKYTSKYSFGACRLDCHTSYVVDMCGCKDVFMPENREDNATNNIVQLLSCDKMSEFGTYDWPAGDYCIFAAECSSGDCQEVADMTVTEEYIHLDTEDDGNEDTFHGSIPLVFIVGTQYVDMRVCYYE
ncbi:uncharacterized protein LOC110440431 [Mizuhopecten yessoensis]|uniref:uncharacterized protein LOC110440431 n=1 Tax=Mizuhopecten yessoensis TaxID=6573 RepID=UPI000B458D3A|nr:uncharacterized protein LOC110440431 [Mizuhopecten yessoensis]